ncbi:hypothetical protein EDC01DRAFT_626168 [Geopyxis carbonaria]|nr:hypothetical protein EDC01DRAFT_626168 [Geopyxis carbonaria]
MATVKLLICQSATFTHTPITMTDSAALKQISINQMLLAAEITHLCSLGYRLTDAALSPIEDQQDQHSAEWGPLLVQHQNQQIDLDELDEAGDVQWIPVVLKEAENVAALDKLRRELNRLERQRARRDNMAKRKEDWMKSTEEWEKRKKREEEAGEK